MYRKVVISLARLRILKKKFFCWTRDGVLRYPRFLKIVA